MGSEARIALRVSPNAPKNEVVGFSDGILRVKIAAPPLKGKANRELVAFLSRLLGVSQSSLAIIRGHTSRSKTVAVSGLSQQELLGRLQSDD
ncbi:MAG TPA: YggU family protein [Dehalococcoidia bacterium]|nr:YggU family protein [Dehalococcoidia bacterium]